MPLTEIFCEVDDFCKSFELYWRKRLIDTGQVKRIKNSILTMSEIMTIIIFFHLSGYRTFKDYYIKYVSKYLRSDFPDIVSYNRFIELSQGVLIPLIIYLKTSRIGKATGISFVDSAVIKACNNRRIHSHKVFNGFAQRAKSSMGWFYGFKLHLLINDKGDILSFAFTPGNVDDRNKDLMNRLTKHLFGKLFGDKGYLSKELFVLLFEQGVQLITKLRKNMKNKLMPLMDKILLRKRAIIETINDQLKNICQIEHTRHRSILNFMVNSISALIAYTYLPKRPSLNINTYNDNKMLPVII